MAERGAQRVRDLEAREAPFYEWVYAHWNLWKERATQGQVVVRGKEIGFQQGRQGRSKYYLHPLKEELVTRNWLVFMQDIRTNSGRHRHPGRAGHLCRGGQRLDDSRWGPARLGRRGPDSIAGENPRRGASALQRRAWHSLQVAGHDLPALHRINVQRASAERTPPGVGWPCVSDERHPSPPAPRLRLPPEPGCHRALRPVAG